jgi:hypothetical protein
VCSGINIVFLFFIGGACIFDNKGNISLSECIFDNCSTVGYGGGFGFYGNGSPLTFFFLSHLFFINSNGAYGKDIGFPNGDFDMMDNHLTFDNVILCRSQNDENRKTNKLVFTTTSSETYDRSCLLPSFLSSSILYVSADNQMLKGGYKSIDRQYCGTSSVRCRTITFGDTTIDRSKDSVIYVSDGYYEERSIISQMNRKKIIIGTSATQTIIKSIYTSESSLFDIGPTISNASLEIWNITFIEKHVNDASHLLFSVTGCNITLNLEDVIISCEDINSVHNSEIILFSSSGRSFIQFYKVIVKDISIKTSVIKIFDGICKIKSCEFNNIVTSLGFDGYGGVFNIEVKQWKTVEFGDGCKFENCSIDMDPMGYGGAIYSKLNEGGIFVLGGRTSFVKCSAKSNSGEGGRGCVLYGLFL